jgi:hypothetical protein
MVVPATKAVCMNGFRVAADVVIACHAGFVGFVALGGLLALRWRRLAWVHLPALGWAVLVEWMGWICPLTPLENELRRQAGAATYAGDFIEHYVVPALYPADLTRVIQILLGGAALGVNALIYSYMWRTRRG